MLEREENDASELRRCLQVAVFLVSDARYGRMVVLRLR